ncbi:hypothetical protein D9758_008556 [Tetrapyrgos nigripes]|uniref:F-box domain-containing protein n=1 Tax=Tetrapyrgos nigripes TaxID=182062 RepID=A0A8H5G5L8_9AGAR|nr:hypothetical protein D9758_008556 [Tetrapyrgos nigripes]
MADSPRLYRELEDYIIDCIPQSDVKSLQSCSLVCHDWRPRCQHHLFNKTMTFIRKYPGETCLERLKRFLETAASSHTILHAVKGLIISHTFLYEHLELPFPNLQSLEIIQFEDSSAVELTDSLLTKLKSNHLRQLTLNGMKLANQQFLLSLFQTVGALSSSTPSRLDYLAFYHCQFRWDDGQDPDPTTLHFLNLTLSLSSPSNFAPFLRQFAFRGLRGLHIHRGFQQPYIIVNQYREHLHSISFHQFRYRSVETGSEEHQLLNTFKEIRFAEMHNLQELNLRHSHTSSSIVQHIISEVTRSPAVRLKRFSVQLDYNGTSRYAPTDLLLANFAIAKADSLEQMDIYTLPTMHDEVLKMVLKKAFSLAVVRFVRLPGKS